MNNGQSMPSNQVPSLIFRLTLALLFLGSPSPALAKDPPVTSLAFTPDGRQIVAVSQSGLTIRRWPELEAQKNIDLESPNPHSVKFAPDGKHVGIGGGEPGVCGTIEIFSWPELKLVSKLGDHGDSIISIAWQSDTVVASASLDKEVRLWDVETGKVIRAFTGHSRGVKTVRFLHDNKTMLTAGIDQSIRVWNSETGELIRSMAMHTKPIHDIAVRPTAEGLPMIASASDDRTVRLWQPTIGRMVRFARLPHRPLNVEWLSDGTRVVAACTDGSVYTIDPDTVEVTRAARVINDWAWALRVHPIQDVLAVGGPNGSIKTLSTTQVRKQTNE